MSQNVPGLLRFVEMRYCPGKPLTKATVRRSHLCCTMLTKEVMRFIQQVVKECALFHATTQNVLVVCTTPNSLASSVLPMLLAFGLYWICGHHFVRFDAFCIATQMERNTHSKI